MSCGLKLCRCGPNVHLFIVGSPWAAGVFNVGADAATNSSHRHPTPSSVRCLPAVSSHSNSTGEAELPVRSPVDIKRINPALPLSTRSCSLYLLCQRRAILDLSLSPKALTLASAQLPPLPCDLSQPLQAFHDGKRLLRSYLTVGILGVEHPDRGGFEGYGGARHPPGEGDLRVEVLLPGGIPHRGPDQDGALLVLL
jgi:hypothetical protein